jgi:hypothetical protein
MWQGSKESICKTVENIGQSLILNICPIESLLETLVSIVGVILCIYSVADDEIFECIDTKRNLHRMNAVDSGLLG